MGAFPGLEEQLTTWEPLGNSRSPDRLDADVWAFTELMLGRGSRPSESIDTLARPRVAGDNPLNLNMNDPKYIDMDRR